MLVTRWQAPLVPEKAQILLWFEMEGLEPTEEVIQGKTLYKDLRYPLDYVMMVAKGELILDIAGNKLLLRAGDRIRIPSNTKFSKQINTGEPCTCITAQKNLLKPTSIRPSHDLFLRKSLEFSFCEESTYYLAIFLLLGTINSWDC